MAISREDRVLRLITIWAWIPAICLLVPYGVHSGKVVPPLGLIPMSISAVFGLVLISKSSTRRGVIISMDVFIAAFLVSIIVPGLVFMAEGRWWWGHHGVVMLGTFATCPLLLNWCIHIYFIVKETGLFFFIGRMFSSPKCPHCSRDLRLLWDMSSNGSVDSKNSYVAVRNEEVEAGPSMEESLPRPSTDDETARLV